MNKRLLAGLMDFCLAAGAANAAFAEDPPLSGPLHTEIATSEDYKEGVAAFKEKRKAKFTGR